MWDFILMEENMNIESENTQYSCLLSLSALSKCRWWSHLRGWRYLSSLFRGISRWIPWDYYKINGCLKGNSVVSHFCDCLDSLKISSQVQNNILEKKMKITGYISDFSEWCILLTKTKQESLLDFIFGPTFLGFKVNCIGSWS